MTQIQQELVDAVVKFLDENLEAVPFEKTNKLRKITVYELRDRVSVDVKTFELEVQEPNDFRLEVWETPPDALRISLMRGIPGVLDPGSRTFYTVAQVYIHAHRKRTPEQLIQQYTFDFSRMLAVFRHERKGERNHV